MNIRYPNITNAAPSEQLAQIKGYLYQLVEQLNMETNSGLPEENRVTVAGGSSASYSATDSGMEQSRSPESTFNQIKSLIIKSADIVDAYYTQMSQRFEGSYVAVSDFGTYREDVAREITFNAGRTDDVFTKVQKIEGEFEDYIASKAYIRSGELFVVGDTTLEAELGQELEEGAPVYGIEIGQTTISGEEDVFHKFARFTAYGMTLYDNNGELAAYITDKKMHIPNVEVKNSMIRGGFQETLENDGDSVERWVGLT